MILLDANYLLRFLLKDDAVSFAVAEDVISNNLCHVPSEVLAEVVFVLLKVYSVAKGDIKDSLARLINHKNIVIESKNTIKRAFEIFALKNIDFVDAILCAKSASYDVRTFDKKLQKCILENQSQNRESRN